MEHPAHSTAYHPKGLFTNYSSIVEFLLYFTKSSLHALIKQGVCTYRVFHLRMCFLKGLKMSENQYVDKKIRQQHNHKASPFDLQPLEWILNLEDSLHSLQHLKTEVRNFAFFCDLSTATTKYLRLWRPASAFKIHSKGFKSNGEAL